MFRLLEIFILVFLIGSAPSGLAQERAIKSDKYAVIINHEEQYSVWLSDRPVPKGWKATGFVGNRDEALNQIAKIDVKHGEDRREMALKLYKELREQQGKSH